MSSCYFCSSSVDIEEHHILPQRFDGSDADSNTVELCHDCHWKLERLYNKEFWEAIGVEDPRATQETHVTCQHHGCLKQAAHKYHVYSITGSSAVYRCENHPPDQRMTEKVRSFDANIEANETENEAVDVSTELRSARENQNTDQEDTQVFLRRLEFVFDRFDAGPVRRSDIETMITGDEIAGLDFSEEDSERVTAVDILTEVNRYSARYTEETGWEVSWAGLRSPL